MVSRGRAAVASAVAALAVVAVVALGHAEQRPLQRTMRFAERGTTLYVTTDVTNLFDKAAYDRLEDGLASTVVIRLWVYPSGKKTPVAFQLLHREVVYDLWGEIYEVAVTGPSGRRLYRVKYKAEALKLVTGLDQVAIAEVGAIPYEKNFELAIVAELNPVSAETMAEVRRWLSDGAGGGLDRGGSFFGSFVSVFVNLKVPDADRVLRLVSQPFYRKRPKR
ncbi:MAG: hypothetical protein IPH44_14950 [Myxococcales bacterium]|nr:hypothetical protein [Myxococcales bacterium]MBK7193229.1 hypothetical protein [Myxococcales bacterium]MBP6848166.1 hypothetical protein [Kofleriaceae bacterium]